jgi:hypothetical protein
VTGRYNLGIAGLLACLTLLLADSPAWTQEFSGNDLRDIRVGMAATELGGAGYVNLACAADPKQVLTGWANWRDCPADASRKRAIRFGYDPAVSRDGTMVAGHPVLLTLSIDDSARVASLQIETDPKARLYIRKKAFLLGLQARSRYGADGWACVDGKPDAGDEPVGGVLLRERCTKTIGDRSLVVERNLFRRAGQDTKSFVDETKINIMAASN